MSKLKNSQKPTKSEILRKNEKKKILKKKKKILEKTQNSVSHNSQNRSEFSENIILRKKKSECSSKTWNCQKSQKQQAEKSKWKKKKKKNPAQSKRKVRITKKVGWKEKKNPAKCLNLKKKIRIPRRIPQKSEFQNKLEF